MTLHLPSELEWLGYLVGVEWPEGDEDQMWALAEDWRTAAAGLRDQISAITDAKSATLAAYVNGDGRDEMSKLFDKLAAPASGDGSGGSILDLAQHFQQLGDSVEETGTEIQYTKLMFYSSIAMAAAEIVIAWAWPPTAPAVEAVIVAMTRIAVRIIGREALERILTIAARMGITAVVKFALKHMVMNTVLGTMQDYAIQQYQVDTGHRKSVNWTQVGVTAISSGVGGAVAGPIGGALGNSLGRRGMNRYLTGLITGTTAGLVGGGAGFVGATAAQFGFDAAQHGWDKAVDNLKHTQFDPRMLTGGMFQGGLSGVNHTGAHTFWEPKVTRMQAGIRPGDLTLVGSRPDTGGVNGTGGTHDPGTSGANGANGRGGAGADGSNLHPASSVGGNSTVDTGARPTGDGSTARPETNGQPGGVATDTRAADRGTPTDPGGSTQSGPATTSGPVTTSDSSPQIHSGDTNGAGPAPTHPQAGAPEATGPVQSAIQGGAHDISTTAPTSAATTNGGGSAPSPASSTAGGSSTGGGSSSGGGSSTGGPSATAGGSSPSAGANLSPAAASASAGSSAGSDGVRAGSPGGAADPASAGARPGAGGSAPGATTGGSGASGAASPAGATAAGGSPSSSGVAASSGGATPPSSTSSATQHGSGATQSATATSDQRANAPRAGEAAAPAPKAADTRPADAPRPDAPRSDTARPAGPRSEHPAGAPDSRAGVEDRVDSPRSGDHDAAPGAEDTAAAKDSANSGESSTQRGEAGTNTDRPSDGPEARDPGSEHPSEAPASHAGSDRTAEPAEPRPDTQRSDDPALPRDDDPTARRDDEPTVAHEDEPPARREDESSARRDDESTARHDDSAAPRDVEPLARHDDSAAPRDVEPLARHDESAAPRDVEPLARHDESAAPRDVEPLARHDESAAPRDAEPLARREDEGGSLRDEPAERNAGEPESGRGDGPLARPDEDSARGDQERVRGGEARDDVAAPRAEDAEPVDRRPTDGREPAGAHEANEPDFARHEDIPVGEQRPEGEMPRSDTAAPAHEEPGARDVDDRRPAEQPQSDKADSERDSRPADRDRRTEDSSAPEDAFVVAPIPVGDGPEVRPHDAERRSAGGHPGGDETSSVSKDRTESADRRDGRRDAPPERTDGSKGHPGTLDDPSNTRVRDEDSTPAEKDDPEAVRERNRGRCGELALRLLRQITGNESIHPPQRRLGPEGMRLEELVAGAGGKLEDFPEVPGKPGGHDAVAERLRKLGDGASALIVDRYAGPADEHGVGAHAYLLVNEGGEIVVKDPAAGLEHGFPPQVPKETKGIHAILFDSDGNPVRPLKASVRAGLLHLADVRVGETDRPGDDAAPERDGGDKPGNGRRENDEVRSDSPRPEDERVRRVRQRQRQRELPLASPEEHEREHGPQQRHDDDGGFGAEDSGDGYEPDWSPRPADDWAELDRDGIVDKLEHDWDLEVTGFDNEHIDVEVLREYARALDDMFTRFPDTELMEVRIAPLDEDGIFAEVDPGRDGNEHFADTLTLNERFARDPAELARRIRANEDSGHLVPGSGERPLYSTIVHEFAHAIDFTTQMHARLDAFEELQRHYLRTRGDYDGFLEWLNDELSGYSFDEHGMFDHAEALAEAFTDVILNDSLASEPAQILHDVLERAYRDHAADNPVYENPAHSGRTTEDPGPVARRDGGRTTDTGFDGVPEPSDPDARRRRMTGRLGSEEPGSAATGRMAGAEPPAHDGDGEKATREPELVLSPPEPPEVPAIADHWTELDRQGVIDRIQNELGIQTVGFHRAGDPEMLREYGRALEDMIAQPPHIKPRSVEIGLTPEDPDAIAIAYAERTEDGRWVPDRIVFNELLALDPDGFERQIRGDVAAGYHVPGADARPMYAVIVHEYAHLVDYYGQTEARDGLTEDLINHYVATHDGADFGEYTAWLHSQLPGYVFDEHGMLNDGEALAEAYRDVKLNGDNASELSKLMAYRLEVAARDAVGLHPPDPTPSPEHGNRSPGPLRDANATEHHDRLGPRDQSEDPANSADPNRPPRPDADRGASTEPPPAEAEEPVEIAPAVEESTPESRTPATELPVDEERWFDRRMAENADFTAEMDAQRARFLHRMADTADPGSAEEHLYREQARHMDDVARRSAERAENLWADLGGRPDPTPETAAGDGQPPNDGPARRASAWDDPDGWFNEQRAIQADWVARMDAERAQWFHDMADSFEPGTREEREARFEARMADAEARLSALRADYMWDIAGGRPDPIPAETSGKPPAASAPRSGDAGTEPEVSHPQAKPQGVNPDEIPTVEVKRSGANPDETPTVEVERQPEPNPDQTATVELPRQQGANSDATPTVEIPRPESESPRPPMDPAEASPGLQAAVDHLRNSTPEAGERPRSLEDQVYGARLTDALDLVEALAKRPDALSALRDLAESARAEGFFEDRANGLGERPHAPAGGEPRTLTLEELRTELLRRLGLPENTPDDQLPRLAGDRQLRNLLRAGGIEALREAVLQHDTATGADRLRAARARDEWARLLGVDDALLDPAHTTPEQRRAVLDELRAETLRQASDVADLMVAAFHHPGSDHTHVVLDADGERVHIRMTEDADGRKHAEIIQRPDLPRETPAQAKEPEKKPGWLKRVWRRMMHGYHGQSPKYPSGSGNDSKGQTMLAMEIGYLTHDEALLHLKDKFNPARILKESVTLWKERERLPLVRHLTARVADVSGDLIPMRTRDGGEYRPHITEADPVVRAEVEESLRLAGLPVESDLPEPRHEPLDHGPALEPPAPREWSADLPQPLVDAVTTRDAALGDLVRVADELGIRIPDDDPKTLRRVVNEAIYKLMRRAGAIEALRDVGQRWLMEDAQIPFSREVSIFDKDPLGRYLREFARAEAIRAEEEKAVRRREEAGAGPDDDSLEFRPREPRPSFLDLHGVNNGGEWPRHFADGDEELSNRREGRLFEDALRRDQIQDERSNWAQLLDIGLDRLGTEEDLKRAITEARMGARDEGRRIAELDAAVDRFLELDADARQHAADLSEVSARDWVHDQGGVMVDPEHGLAVLPGEPRRLVVIRGEADHDARLIDSLSVHPEIRDQLNRGELRLDYRVVGLDGADRVQVIPVDPPQIRFHDVEVNGERTPVALLRNGLEPWRIVQPTPEPAPTAHTETHAEPAVLRDPDEVRRERNEVASRLSVYRMDLGANLARTIEDLHHDNALRAAQIEGMADFIRSSDDIDTFHDLDRTLQNLAHRLGLAPDELTPRKLAEAMADPNVRKVRRLQAVDDLIKYAKVLRENVDEKAVLAARKELAARLDVAPEDLSPAKAVKENGEIVGFAPDSKNTDKKALLDAINGLLHDSAEHPELLAALTEYGSLLGELDPFRQNLRYDPLTDPRAVDGELPIHDADAPAMLRAFMNESIGEPPHSDNPSAAAGVWSRLLGVQMNDFAKTVKIYAEQLGSLHDRLTPAQFADVLTTLRETGDSTVAYERYRDNAADPAKLLTKEQLADVVRGVRNARYAEVYEAYRDGKIEKHERRSVAELADTIDAMRAEVAAREADIKLLEKLAAEHDALTNPRPPEGPPRDPRAVATDLAAARHELQIAAEGRDYAQARVYRENSGPGFRPLLEDDLTPGHLAGTTDYLANRPAEEGGALRGLDRRLSDLATAAGEFDAAQARVHDLESEMRRAVAGDTGPGESQVDAWKREVDTARAELDALLAANPDLARQGFDRMLEDIDRLSRMPQQWGDVFTDELVPLRDAVHRYEQAREFLSAAEAEAAAAARAAESPAQTAARELATARTDLADAAPADRLAAQDRVTRWEAEQRLLDAKAAAVADSPHRAAERVRAAAHDDLTLAIDDFRRATGLDVTEPELAPDRLRDTIDRLLPEAGGNLPEVVGAFERLQDAAEAAHRADALADWVDAHFHESEPDNGDGPNGRDGEDPGDPGASGDPTRPQGPTQPNSDPSAATREPGSEGGEDGSQSNAVTHNESGDGDINRSFAQRVEHAIAAGEAEVVVLSTGMGRMAERVELVTFATEPPTQLIRKIVTNPQHAHAEALVSLVGRAVGANVPQVHQVEDRVLYMEVMPGEVGADRFTTTMDEGLDAVLTTPDGRRLGLLDVLVGIPDRNLVNWLITADGRISGIDHSLAFGGGRRGDELSTSIFARQYATEGPDGEITWHTHDLTVSDLADIRTRLDVLAPEFAALGRDDWHRAMMDRFDEIQRHARPDGDESTGTEGDPGPDPSRPGSPVRPGADPSAATPPTGATPPGSGGGNEPPNRNSSTPPDPDPEEPGNSGQPANQNPLPAKPDHPPTVHLPEGGQESGAVPAKPDYPPTAHLFEGNDDPTVEMEGGSAESVPPGSEDPTVELTRPSEAATLELPRVEVEAPPVDPVADSPALSAAAQFLREAANDPAAPAREVNAVVFTARLMDALGLEGAAAHLHDPLAHFRAIAEMAKARGFFGDPDQPTAPRPMRNADDYRPLRPEEIYGTEEYWRTEADPEALRAIEAELQESGLARRLAELESGEAARTLDPGHETRELPSSTAQPDGSPVPNHERPLEPWAQRPHDPAHTEPHVYSLDELRSRLAREFGLSETDLQRENLPRHAGDMQNRNMFRAGGLEALDHVLAAHDTATGPEREHLARVRDEWARLLGIPESALDPAHTTPEQRNAVLARERVETLRRAMDVADLLVAALHVPDRGVVHVVLEAEGERVHARIVERPGGKQIEVIGRPELDGHRSGGKPAPGWVEQLWRRMMHGYHGQSPKYPSGSRWDSFGFSTMAAELGYTIHNDLLEHIKDKFNPVRVAKEFVTFWQNRERMPLMKYLTRRIADISPEALPMRTPDGGEYRPHVTEADPRLLAEMNELLRIAGMPIASEIEPRHQPLEPAEIKEPPPREWGTDVPQPLADAVDARDAALLDLVRAAREHGIHLADDDPETVRRALREANYRLGRRAGAVEALRDVGRRWILEDGVVPFSREISIFDKDPLGRYIRELAHARALNAEEMKAHRRREEAGVAHDNPPLEYRAREPRPSFLEVEGVNNGGEWVRHFDDVDGELSNSREGELFEIALHRDQIQEERSNWAQLLDVGLDRIETQQGLDHVVADERAAIRDARDRMAGFKSVVDRFLGADTEFRDRVQEVSEAATREWVDAGGGVLLDPEHGLAVLPGEDGGPERLVVIRGDTDHDSHLVDALADRPDLRRMLNHGELRLDYRDVGLDEQNRVRVVAGETPRVRFHDVEVDGRSVPVALMRGGEGSWRAVQPTPEAVPHAPSSEPAVPRDPNTVRAERNAVARRLAIYDMDLGANLERTIEGLRQDLALRTAQLEGAADFIRTSDAIETFNDLHRALGNLANRLRLDPEQLSPRRVAEAFADTRIRMGERRHQAFADLISYADTLRKNIDEPAALAARDRLVSKLGVDPEELHKLKAVKDEEKVDIIGFEPDKKSTNPLAIAEAFENLIFRPDERRAQAIDALTEYLGALSDLDPFRDGGLRFDPLTDPRVATGELPVHDPRALELLEALSSDFLGEPPLLDDPVQAGGVWSRLLGVDTFDIDKTVKIYQERLGRLHDRISPDQLREVLRTLKDTNHDMDAAYRGYRDSVTDTRKLLSAEQVSEVVRVVRHVRYTEVYEAYRDGKIEKHERLTPKELAKAIDAVRAEHRARAADIDLLERLAAEHHNLTNPPEPAAPPRDPRTVATDLAAARHELQVAEEGLDYAKGRMWRERDGDEAFRPLTDSDLTPERLAGTEDYLANRNRAEGGELPGNEQRISDLSAAAREFDRAQARVTDLESELDRGVRAGAGPGETSVDAWRREVEAARTDLETLVATDPVAAGSLDHAIDQVERMSRMPVSWNDVWPDELIPLRDAVHRYRQAEEFLARAEAAESDAAAAAARAAETPEQLAARELAGARDDLTAAETQRDTVRRDAAAARVARWEAEQRRLDGAAAAAVDTPQTAAHRAREAARGNLTAAIADFRRVTGLDVTEADLAPDRLHHTIADLLARAGGNLPDTIRAFDQLQSAAETFHDADAVAGWVDDHYPDPVRALPPGDGEPGGTPKPPGPGAPPDDPTGGAPARPGPNHPGTDPATAAEEPETGVPPVSPITHSSTATTHSGSNEVTGAHAVPENVAPAQNTGEPPVNTPPDDVNGAVMFEGDLPSGPDATPLYRGVPRLLPDGSVSPAYLDGLQGIVSARGDLDLDYAGHTSHLGERSDSTSWSRSRAIAETFARGDGLIMEWRTGLPPEDATWRFKPTYDIDDDFSQVLIQGTLTDARATRYLPTAENPSTSGVPAEPAAAEPGGRVDPARSSGSAPGDIGDSGEAGDPADITKPRSDNDSQHRPVEEPTGSADAGDVGAAEDPAHPGAGGRDGDDSVPTAETPFRYSPNWRSHLPLVPHPFDPDFPDYTPKPPEQPAPWTLPPESNPPHHPPQPSHPQPSHPQPPATSTPPHQPTPPRVPPNTPQPPHIPQAPNIPNPPQPPAHPHIPVPPNVPMPPHIPQPPHLPQPPHIPGLPQLPNPPHWPQLPTEPARPQLPPWPTDPGTPPQQPSNPGVPHSLTGSGMPQPPTGPVNSGLPHAPGDPGGHGAPSQPGGPQQPPQYPGAPRQPSDPGAPQQPGTPPQPQYPGAPQPPSNPVVPQWPSESGMSNSGPQSAQPSVPQQGFPGGAPMMPPVHGGAGNGGGNGNSRGSGRFPRASVRPASDGQIYLRSHSGFGEYALMDPMTGQLSTAPVGTGAPSGVFDDLDGLRVVFYRDPAAGLVLRVGDQVVELDRLAAGALWERLGQGFHRLVIGRPGDVRCELRYSERPADNDLGLLIRDVLSDPARRSGIFG